MRKLGKDFVHRFLWGVLCLVLCFAIPASCIAISDATLDKFAANNIMFTEEDDGCYGTLDGDTLVEKVLSYLLSQRLSPVATAGIYGNMMHEGLGAGHLLEHENGVDSRSDIGTEYGTDDNPFNLWDTDDNNYDHVVQEKHVRDLMNVHNMHGFGLIQWSFERRVNLINKMAESGLDHYATDWDDTSGTYVYDNKSYDDLIEILGQAKTDEILRSIMDFFMEEHKSSYYNIQANDIAAQGLSSYGITAGMPLFDALNKLDSAYKAAELFFSTSEMPAWTGFNERQVRRGETAEEGLQMLQEKGITGTGPQNCRKGNGTAGNTIAEIAVNMAWPNSDGTCFHGNSTISWNTNDPRCHADTKPEYVTGFERARGYRNLSWEIYTDCAVFSGVVVKLSGVDDNFPVEWPEGQLNYANAHPELWEKIPNLHNTDNMRPGDIILNTGHAQVYVGEKGVFDGGSHDLASASRSGYTPKLKNMYFSHDSGEFRFFRSTVDVMTESTKPITPLDEPSDGIPCANGTKDLGVYNDAHYAGNQIKIRLCALTNLPTEASESNSNSEYYFDGADGYTIVNSRVSGAYYTLVERAKAAGFTDIKSSSGLRSYAHQRALYECYINHTPGCNTAAEPGKSKHEAGLAIDFKMGANGSSFDSCPSTPNFGSISGGGWYSPLSKFFCQNLDEFGLRRPVLNESWHMQP